MFGDAAPNKTNAQAAKTVAKKLSRKGKTFRVFIERLIGVFKEVWFYRTSSKSAASCR